MQIHVYSDKQMPMQKHHYYINQAGDIFPAFDPVWHTDEVVLLLESGIITPSVQQSDRITEIEAMTLPKPEFHFQADE